MIVDSVLDRLLIWRVTRVCEIWNDSDYVVDLFFTDWAIPMQHALLAWVYPALYILTSLGT